MFVAHSLDLDPIPNESESIPAHELREFIDGGSAPTGGDPAFRERLREQLWTMLEARCPERVPPR